MRLKNNPGFGMRSRRYAVIANDMTIDHALLELDFNDDCSTEPLGQSEAVLARLTGAQPPHGQLDRQAFVG